MQRKIIGYHKDERDDWVAELDCFHGQHVRHDPPFTNRPWVETEMGRSERLGEPLNCVRCDRLEFPEQLVPYKKTPEFDETSIPKGLLADHATKVGTWGEINVLEGQLIFTMNEPEKKEYRLDSNTKGVIPPLMKHNVRADGRVRFYVQFFSQADS